MNEFRPTAPAAQTANPHQQLPAYMMTTELAAAGRSASVFKPSAGFCFVPTNLSSQQHHQGSPPIMTQSQQQSFSPIHHSATSNIAVAAGAASCSPFKLSDQQHHHHMGTPFVANSSCQNFDGRSDIINSSPANATTISEFIPTAVVTPFTTHLPP